jgi:hypothetical protein
MNAIASAACGESVGITVCVTEEQRSALHLPVANEPTIQRLAVRRIARGKSLTGTLHIAARLAYAVILD